MHTKILKSILVFLILIVFVLGLGLLSNSAIASFPSSEPQGMPTPWPTTILPEMTPVPIQSPERDHFQKEAVAIPTMLPTPLPDDPYIVSSHSYRPLFPSLYTELAEIVIRGTVKQVLSPRWTTPDGNRPANPWKAQEFIYRPVVIDVIGYYKGELKETELIVMAYGGEIGNDRMWDGEEDFDKYKEGEQVVLFLLEPISQIKQDTIWNVIEHYTVENDIAFNARNNLPFSDLALQINQTMEK